MIAFGCVAPDALLPNQLLYERAREFGKKYSLPVILQGEFTTQMRIEGYVSTLRLLGVIRRVTQKNGVRWKRILIVASPDHTPRVLRDARLCGFWKAEADDYFVGREAEFFSPLSNQWWTRSRWLFLPRELILRHMPWELYRRIAG